MPILPAEPNLFPEGLFEDLQAAQTDGRVWRVLHTKPRQEKSLARQLLQGQLPFYLPLIARRTLIRKRLLTAHVPLFGGYCFLLANEKERIKALATRRVVRALDVPDQQRLCKDLQQVYKLIASGAPITPEGKLVPGTPVEIRTGPLTGLKGVILRTAKLRRFVVQVNFIQQGASVELEDYMLVPSD